MKLSDRRAIIVGHRGQDGRLLSELLLSRGYQVLGIGRQGCDIAHTNLNATPPFDLADSDSTTQLLRQFPADEIYYLAAYHTSSDRKTIDQHAAGLIENSYRVHVQGAINFLQAIADASSASRFFYASSSLIFADTDSDILLSEQTQPAPANSYALTKCLGMQACKAYRDERGVFASSGILFNHESKYRAANFLVPKVILAAIRIADGSDETLTIGNLDATVDWGYAGDYVDAFTRILALSQPDDFVIATGHAHTVRDLVSLVFESVGLDWQAHVQVDPSVIGRHQRSRIGDAKKLRDATGWKPTVTFEQMVADLVEAFRRPT